MEACPNGNVAYEIDHSSFYDSTTTTVEWEQFSNANNCKMLFKVPSDLNGKLVLEIEQNDANTLTLYQFPNSMNEGNNNGIIENDLVYDITTGTYFVPTDWTMYFIYNLSFMPGKLVIHSKVELLTVEDQELIEESFGEDTEIIYDPEQSLPTPPEDFDFESLDIEDQVDIIDDAIENQVESEDITDAADDILEEYNVYPIVNDDE